MYRQARKALVAGIACFPFMAFSVTHTNKNVGMIEATVAGVDCFYFRLVGVTQADPVLPGQPWFSIPRSQLGSGQAYAALLSAKLMDKTVQVATNGTISCGLATASEVILE